MLDVANTTGPAQSLLDSLDPTALGFVSRTDAAAAIRRLFPVEPSTDEIAAMINFCTPGSDGLIHRETSATALGAAFAKAAKA